MTTYAHDGSYAGFLSAVFVAYHEREMQPVFVQSDAACASLFGDVRPVETCGDRAARVESGIRKHGTPQTPDRLRRAFLSEAPQIDRHLWAFLRLLFSEGVEAAENPLGTCGPAVEQAARMTGREVHRMHAFVRFEARADGWWYATVEPECHVLPLIGPHFQERFGSMRWVIVDARRRLGLCHESGSLWLGPIDPADEAATPDERGWQQLWQAYYEAVNIPERENLRLRQRHMPRRYWWHLTELRAR